jgi:transposase InsO family protein
MMLWVYIKPIKLKTAIIARCSFEELKKRIEEYIIYYNNKRIKEKLAGMSPVQYRIHTSPLAA